MSYEEKLLDFFRALGQKERLLIAGQLVQGDMDVPELSRRTGLKEMDLLRHLSLMEEMGLVRASETIYHFDLERLHDLNRAVWSAVKPAAKTPENEEEAILQRFVSDGRIVDLPAKAGKLEVILRWLARQIPSDETFSEREISDLLAGYHPDYASLRRYLVDYKLLARDQGIYWRVEEEE